MLEDGVRDRERDPSVVDVAQVLARSLGLSER
jgi:hypothetical protein